MILLPVVGIARRINSHGKNLTGVRSGVDNNQLFDEDVITIVFACRSKI